MRFGERLAVEVKRAPSSLRSHYFHYSALKEVLDRPNQCARCRETSHPH